MNYEKEMYSSPEVTIVEVKTEGVICGSPMKAPNNYEYGGNPFGY